MRVPWGEAGDFRVNQAASSEGTEARAAQTLGPGAGEVKEEAEL